LARAKRPLHFRVPEGADFLASFDFLNGLFKKSVFQTGGGLPPSHVISAIAIQINRLPRISF
jgi:hypothetical protein